METIYKAEDLRTAWLKSTLSQEEIAAKIGVSQPAVSMALAGKRGNSRKGQQTLKKIAQVLKIEAEVAE